MSKCSERFCRKKTVLELLLGLSLFILFVKNKIFNYVIMCRYSFMIIWHCWSQLKSVDSSGSWTLTFGIPVRRSTCWAIQSTVCMFKVWRTPSTNTWRKQAQQKRCVTATSNLLKSFSSSTKRVNSLSPQEFWGDYMRPIRKSDR